MPVIELVTKVNASVEVCFDLSRSIDLHMETSKSTDEKAVAGVTSGLIGAGQHVTWQARHFGVLQTLTSKITQFDQPRHFRDSMQEGIFARIDHDHFFESENGLTVMRDRFDYESPLGWLGLMADTLFLKRYMTKFLAHRNAVIKNIAETCPEKYIRS